MKTGNAHWIKLTLLAVMLALANRSHALYTNYLDAVVAALNFQYNALTNDPAPTPSERQQIALIGRALRTLAKPATNVIGDYNLFVTAATQLGPIASDPQFLTLGTNVFNAFTNEAQAQIGATGERIAALNHFVPTKRGASNNLRQAQLTLDRIPTLSNTQLALVLGRQVFSKIGAANRLAARGEANPGFAADSVAGTSITHMNRGGGFGTITFVDATNYTEIDDGSELGGGTYTYTRTGLNTAILVINGVTPEVFTVTVKLTFTAANAGKFSAREAGNPTAGTGTFTIP